MPERLNTPDCHEFMEQIHILQKTLFLTIYTSYRSGICSIQGWGLYWTCATPATPKTTNNNNNDNNIEFNFEFKFETTSKVQQIQLQLQIHYKEIVTIIKMHTIKIQYENRTQTAWSDAAAGETQSEVRMFLFGQLK